MPTVLTPIPDSFLELSKRTVQCLKCHGYETREDILEGVINGYIDPKREYGIGNYGKKSHKEVLDWLGEDAKVKRPLTEQHIKRMIGILDWYGYTVYDGIPRR